MTSEFWQFAVLVAGFFVAAVLWLFVIYLPGRTMEYSEARRLKGRDEDNGASG